MTQVIIRFFSLEPVTVIPLAYWGLLGVWLLMFLTIVGSISSQGWSRAAKTQWILAIFLIPVVSAVVYCILCLLRGDYSGLRFMGFKKRKI